MSGSKTKGSKRTISLLSTPTRDTVVMLDGLERSLRRILGPVQGLESVQVSVIFNESGYGKIAREFTANLSVSQGTNKLTMESYAVRVLNTSTRKPGSG